MPGHQRKRPYTSSEAAPSMGDIWVHYVGLLEPLVPLGFQHPLVTAICSQRHWAKWKWLEQAIDTSRNASARYWWGDEEEDFGLAESVAECEQMTKRAIAELIEAIRLHLLPFWTLYFLLLVSFLPLWFAWKYSSITCKNTLDTMYTHYWTYLPHPRCSLTFGPTLNKITTSICGDLGMWWKPPQKSALVVKITTYAFLSDQFSQQVILTTERCIYNNNAETHSSCFAWHKYPFFPATRRTTRRYWDWVWGQRTSYKVPVSAQGPHNT